MYQRGSKDVAEQLKRNIDGVRSAWVCKTCDKYMQGDKMPPTCHKNGLEIVEVPELARLNKFDNMLLARKILFMFVSQLPVSRMEALKGKVTLVPIEGEDVLGTVAAGQSMPRTPTEAGLVTYELRKKQTFKQTVGRPQLVNPKWLGEALKVLKKAGNPYYQMDFDSVDSYRARCVEEDPKGVEVAFPEIAEGDAEVNRSEEEGQGSEAGKESEHTRYDKNQDPVQRNQLVQVEDSSCLVQNNPETERTSEDSIISVAPGEDRRPEGIVQSRDWDVQAHPRLHNPDGSNGLHQDGRQTRLTDQQYFGQRVKNVNNKWAADVSYVCAAVSYLEKKQINSNTSMAYTSGKRVNKEGGKVAIEHHDAWSVLRGITNSPKFWRDKKAEVIATMDNYGAFQWFWTLSCADKRWQAVLATIARSFPEVEDIIYQDKGGIEMEIKVKVKDVCEEVPLEKFMDSLDQSKHELLRTNVLAVTRYFDMKVRSFIKNIMMGDKNPMCIILYTYRIEFQKRGHPHAHGCLWIDIDKMDVRFPGLKSAFNSLRHGKALMQVDNVDVSRLKEVEALVNWIDSFVTCSLNKARVGAEVADLAEELQSHGHTKRCHKKSENCG